MDGVSRLTFLPAILHKLAEQRMKNGGSEAFQHPLIQLKAMLRKDQNPGSM